MAHPLHMPIGLAEIIETHRALFGDTVMSADEGEKAGEKIPDAGEPAKNDAKAETLGEGGIKALQAERDARKALEAQVKELQGKAKDADEAKKVIDGLAALFAKDGDKPDPTADLAALVAELKRESDETKAAKVRDALAAKIATDAGVTDARESPSSRPSPTRRQ